MLNPGPTNFVKLFNLNVPGHAGAQVLVYLEHDGADDMILHQIIYRAGLGTVDMTVNADNQTTLDFYEGYTGQQARVFWDKINQDMDEMFADNDMSPDMSPDSEDDEVVLNQNTDVVTDSANSDLCDTTASQDDEAFTL